MSVFNKFYFWFVVGAICANTAVAVSADYKYYESLGVDALGKWGDGRVWTCDPHNIEKTICIGKSRDNDCATAKDKGIRPRGAPTDERAILMMVARKVKDTCAYFCPTQIEAKNEDKHSTWTEYADASKSDNSDCVWLCQDGDWSTLPSNDNICDN
ncbi:MAG: hypothetical protein ACLRFJ_02775, partial [Alphaproteobacteria bacterium]